MTARQLAQADGRAPDQPTLSTYAHALRDLRDAGLAQVHGHVPGAYQRAPSIRYAATAAARRAFLLTVLRAIEVMSRPKPARQAPAHWWDADASTRYRAGATLLALGRMYGVKPPTVKRALMRQGVSIRADVGGRRRADPNPPWAAEAARRYTAGEGLAVLLGDYRTRYSRLKQVLRSQGVATRRPGNPHRAGQTGDA